MKRFAIAAIALWLAAFPAAADEPFSFIAFGDTEYEPATDDALYEKLIAVINRAGPAFSIHLGDTKGLGDCGEAFQLRQRDFFNTLDAPLIYAPGNNEWADCWRAENGAADPVEILSLLRGVFFKNNLSLGKNPMVLERQSAMPGFEAFVENAMWERDGILFVTLHLVGSGNNLLNINDALFAEFLARDRANEAWINAAFARVREKNLKGVVFAFHASLWLGTADYRGGPFERVTNALKAGAAASSAQVLVINAHAHAFIVDKPWQTFDIAAKTFVFGNLTRLQVPGWPEHKAVEVTVDPESPGLWSFREIYDPDNLSAGFKK